jgi:hypothetical protein
MRAGFRDVRAERVPAPLRMKSAEECLHFEQESFGALHQMLSSLEPSARDEAWREVGAALEELGQKPAGFVGPCELIVAVGTRP